ncbi:MAG: amidohydrolase family protein [Gemmatimonadetes bacterium]|nr:amidohydrolase family protein [Gemmatimonadota bacterium]
MLIPFLVGVSLQLTVIRDVTVIDGPDSRARPHMDVTVQEGRIREVMPTRRAAPGGARIIDGRGKFLLPGFVDTHAHVAIGPVSYRVVGGTPEMSFAYDHAASLHTLRTLLAFGVTMIRNPGGPAELAVALRDSLERGLLVGPRVRTAGEAIDVFASPGMGRAASTPEAMREEVRRQAALGVDYIKLYAGLTLPLVKAGVEEAHARGLKAITHTAFTTWTDAANAGVDGIVHVVPGSPALIAADRRPDYIKTMKGTQFMATWFRFADTSSREVRAMIEALVQHQTWLDLTLVTFDAMFRGNTPAIRESADLAHAAPVLRENWRGFDLAVGWTPQDFADAAAVWPRVEAFVQALYRAGVRMTVGTDANNPWTVPGISFHREMELLVKAGIPAPVVLRMATLDGAKSLGLDGEIGTVEAGKRADLVLLDADPRANISNTQRIAQVFLRGVAHPAAR